MTLARDATETIEDVVTSRFDLAAPSLGHIQFIPDHGSRFVVTSRTYSTVQDGVGTFGSGVPTLSASSGIRAGESKTFGGLYDSTEETIFAVSGGTFRTNLGLVEASGAAVEVRVSVLFATGNSLAIGGSSGSRTFSLAARELKQLNGIVSSILGSDTRETTLGDLDNIQVKVEVLNGDGSVLVYTTLTDNGNGDTFIRAE